MFCEVCGKEIKEGQSFCPVCGSPVNNSNRSLNNNVASSGAENSEIMQDPHRQQRTRVTYNADNYTNNNASYNSRNNAVRNNTYGNDHKHPNNDRTNSNVTYNSMNNSGRNVGSSRNGSSNGKASGQGMSASKKKYAVKLVAIISAIVILFGSVGGYFIWRSKNRKIEAYFKPFSYEDIVFPETGDAYIKNELILKAAKKASFKNIKNMVEEAAGEIVGYISISNDYQVEFSDEKDQEELSDIINQWTGNALVASVDFHYVYESDGSIYDYTHDEWWDYTKGDKPDDFEEDWNIYAPNGNNWGVESVWMPLVWEKDVDFSDIKVGIIDTVFDDDHPDLTDRFKKLENNPAFIDYEPGTNSATDADDTNTPTDADDTNTPTDAENLYHGTHVAGIIGANIDDGIGVAGVAQNSELYGFSVTDTEGNIYTSIMEWKYAIVSQLLEGVKAINISMDLNPVDADAIDEFNDELGDFITICADNKFDFLIVKAAENENSTCPGFITGITNDAARNRIIIVGGAEPVYSAEGKLTGYKAIVENENLPKDYYDNIDIYAPGKEVDSDVPGGLTENHDGNSVAAPFVTGEAALIWGINQKLSAFDVKDIILENYIYTVTAYDIARPYANAYLAVEAAIRTKDSHYESPDVPTSTDATVDVTDATTEEAVVETNDKELLEKYLYDVLIPEHGVYNPAQTTYSSGSAFSVRTFTFNKDTKTLELNWDMPNDPGNYNVAESDYADLSGLIYAEIGDYDGDEKEELLVIRGDEKGGVTLEDYSKRYPVKIELYFVQESEAVIKNEITAEIWDEGYIEKCRMDGSKADWVLEKYETAKNYIDDIYISTIDGKRYLTLSEGGWFDISGEIQCAVIPIDTLIPKTVIYYDAYQMDAANYAIIDKATGNIVYESYTEDLNSIENSSGYYMADDFMKSKKWLGEDYNHLFYFKGGELNDFLLKYWYGDDTESDGSEETTEEAVDTDTDDADSKEWKQAYLDYLNAFVKDEENSEEENGYIRYIYPEPLYVDEYGDEHYVSYGIGNAYNDGFYSVMARGSDKGFNVMYLDNDDIPEILLIDDYDMFLLTYYDNKVVPIELGFTGSYDYSEREGLFATSSWGRGSDGASTSISELKDGELKDVLYYHCTPVIEPTEFIWLEGEYDYDRAQENMVTEEEYNAKVQEFKNSHNFRYSLSKDYDSDRYEDFESSKDEKTKEEVIAYISGL